MKRFVYLAGPIAGCSYEEATDWREEVSGMFAPGIVGVSPMRLKEWCRRFHKIGSDVEEYRKGTTSEEYMVSGDSHAICARDFFDVDTSDMIFVYRPTDFGDARPLGTAIEIGRASFMHKPIVLVTELKSLIHHPLVRECVGWIVPTLEMGAAVVNSVLGVYASGEENDPARDA